jgi:hypothetical protein
VGCTLLDLDLSWFGRFIWGLGVVLLRRGTHILCLVGLYNLYRSKARVDGDGTTRLRSCWTNKQKAAEDGEARGSKDGLSVIPTVN